MTIKHPTIPRIFLEDLFFIYSTDLALVTILGFLSKLVLIFSPMGLTSCSMELEVQDFERIVNVIEKVGDEFDIKVENQLN